MANDLASTRPGILSRLAGAWSRAARRAASIMPGQYYGSSLTTPVLSGVVVTPQTALTLTAVMCAQSTISTDIAKLPFGVVENVAQGGFRPADHPRNNLVAVQPNPEMNAYRFWATTMGHALGWGNGLSEIVRDQSDGSPIALWPLHPGTTKARRDQTTKRLFYEDTNTGKKYLPENILHIADFGFDGIEGYSAVMSGRQAVGLAVGAEQFGASFFGNSAIPQGYLKTPKKLSNDAVKRLRDSFELVHGGSQNANRLAVFEEGLEWAGTQISPEAAQFLATRQFQILEICRMFRIPPNKLMDYSQSHLANVEQQNQDYLDSTLSAWLKAIVAECNAKLLFADERPRFSFRHDISDLLRGDTAARGAFYQVLKGCGAINADTIAAREGLPIPGPENGGHLYLTQIQNRPQQDAGKPQPKIPADSPIITS